MPNRLPLLAVLLGLGGLIPFLGCGAGALAFGADWANRSLLGLVAYGACILSFLGAVHWGFALGAAAALPPGGLQLLTLQPAGVLCTRLALGVLPALIGWVALLVAFFGPPSIALAVLTFGFVATIIAEAQADRRGLLPPGYVWLRWVLSVVVIVVLVSVALARVMGEHVKF